VQPGDVLLRANETPVYTSADLKFALNTVPDAGKVTLLLQRKGRTLPARTLSLPRGWRRTDISWRPSQEVAPPMIGIWMQPLAEEQKRQQNLPPERMALRITFAFPGEAWAKTRGELKMDDVIVGINGQAFPSMTTRQFHSYFRLHFEVGDTVTLNVRRNGQALNIAVPCLDVPSE